MDQSCSTVAFPNLLWDKKTLACYLKNKNLSLETYNTEKVLEGLDFYVIQIVTRWQSEYMVFPILLSFFSRK